MATKINKSGSRKVLRWGYTTGTCATAATRAALEAILKGTAPKTVPVRLPGGRTISIPIKGVEATGEGAIAAVVKDGGDDPDCTHGAEIQSKVVLFHGSGDGHQQYTLNIKGGKGVGMVTRPGLAIEPGQWAINPVPRNMIHWAVEDVLGSQPDHQISMVDVEIRVPRGEELAAQTLNPRLGIVGGISILGTTGLVKPFSHGAYRATIYTALKVARANGIREMHLVTGSTTDAFARSMNPGVPELAFCQMADYVKFTMEWVAKFGFSCAHVYTFWGKAVKIAQGLPQTHASQGEVDLGLICEMALKETKDPAVLEELRSANTARHSFDILKKYGLSSVIGYIGDLALHYLKVYTKNSINITYKLLDFDGTILWQGV